MPIVACTIFGGVLVVGTLTRLMKPSTAIWAMVTFIMLAVVQTNVG